MAASAFLVTPPDAGGHSFEGGNAIVVFAEDATDAKTLAASQFSGKNAAQWAASTATPIVAGTDLLGYRLRVAILDASPVIDVTVTGIATNDLDDIADLMVIALNADAQIAGAAYSTPNLTIAETTDTLGDKEVLVQFLPPATSAEPDTPIAGFVGTITDQGSAGAALAVALVPSRAIPSIGSKVKV